MYVKTCPRCASADLLHGEHGTPEASGPSYVQCSECGHMWSDDYLPDTQGVPLPDGFVDCGRCDGAGEVAPFDRCARCHGVGIVEVPA